MKPLFSVVLIAKNESRNLPRLADSLKEFQERGGEIVLVDTGSADGTPEIARDLGCCVLEEGERFIKIISADLAKNINSKFVVDGESALVGEGDRVFDYSEARNYAASLASNDFVAMPDCDEEYTAFDIESINDAIRGGFGQLEYNFVFAHDQFGNEAVKFMHCKFYDRTKLHWVGMIHEVLAGQSVGKFLPEDKLKLEHWQNPTQGRGHYLTGLAWDCFLNPNNDRNSHYFGRELMYKGRFKSAIRELERHIDMNGWAQERAQSMVFVGDCYASLNQIDQALEWWSKSFVNDGSRREPLMRLAHHFYKCGDRQKTAAFCSAALTIPWTPFYGNRVSDYAQDPHQMMYWALWDSDSVASKSHWESAIKYQPLNPKFLNACQWYLKPELNLDAFRGAIRSKEKFGFIKIGDGEEQAAMGQLGQTCDGQKYSPELGKALRESFTEMAGKFHVVHWQQQDLVNLILHRKPNDPQKLKAFWGEIRKSTSPKVFVGPKRLEWVSKFLKTEFVEVSTVDAWSGIDETMRSVIGHALKPNAIVLVSCGPAAKVMLARILKVPCTATCIDCGSTFDPICGIESRTEQYGHQELLDLYSDWFDEDGMPGVSICIPTLGREQQLQWLIKAIPRLGNYPRFELVIERDNFENRQGVSRTLNRAVARAKFDEIMFLGNDCVPSMGFLANLMAFHKGVFLTGINDGFWKHGEIATHWVASKKLLPLIGGEFFHSGYNHVGCDNELTARCKKLGRYAWCESSKISHLSAAQGQCEPDEVSRIAWNPESVEKDRLLLATRAKELGFEAI